MMPENSIKKNQVHWLLLIICLATSTILYFLLPDWPQKMRLAASFASLMAFLWLYEAIPVMVTALLPIIFFPILGLQNITQTTKAYAHPLIFLFMGGFMMAKALEKTNLHRRFALTILGFMGSRPSFIIAGFLACSFFLSMWISNTATAVMMLAIGLGTLEALTKNKEFTKNSPNHFATCLLLAIAYGCSVGGTATLIGSPPNALFAAFYEQNFGQRIYFLDWLIKSLPLALLFLVIVWGLLVFVLFPSKIKKISGINHWVNQQKNELGLMTQDQKRVLAIFFLVATLWIIAPWIKSLLGQDYQVHDAGIALFGVFLLFIIPDGTPTKKPLLDWEHAKKIPWDILLLFGGGLSLASLLVTSGLANTIANAVLNLGIENPFWILFLVVGLIVFMTEIMSNTATVAAFLPILSAIALQLNINPMMILFGATIAASFAFMMPIATPPNAIVFSSQKITIKQMAKAGFWLNLIGIGLLTFYCWLIF